jgi:hypothetical protein
LTKKVKLRCSWSVVKSLEEVDGAAVMKTNWDRRARDDEPDNDERICELWRPGKFALNRCSVYMRASVHRIGLLSSCT